MLLLLLFLSGTSCFSHHSLLLLQVAVSEHLLATDVLLLQSPEPLFLLLGFLEQFLLLDLESTLMHDLVLLRLAETFEMVRLHAVRGQHGLLGGWVFSHEIVVQSKVLVACALELHLSAEGSISVSLLLRKLSVGIAIGLLHHGASLSMLLLLFLQKLVEVQSLLIIASFIKLGLFLVQLLLSHLLSDPVGLL